MGLWPVKVDFAMCQFVPIGAEQKAREKMLGSTCLFFEYELGDDWNERSVNHFSEYEARYLCIISVWI